MNEYYIAISQFSEEKEREKYKKLRQNILKTSKYTLHDKNSNKN